MPLLSADAKTQGLLIFLNEWRPKHYRNSGQFLKSSGDDPLLKGVAESMVLFTLLNVVAEMLRFNNLTFNDELNTSFINYSKVRDAQTHAYNKLSATSPLREVVWVFNVENQFPIWYLGCVEFAKMRLSDQNNLFRLLETLSILKRNDSVLKDERFDIFLAKRLAADKTNFIKQIVDTWESLRPIPTSPGSDPGRLKALEFDATPLETPPPRSFASILYGWKSSKINVQIEPKL